MQGGPFLRIPKMGALCDLAIELMAERHDEWKDFPEWCRNANNATYRCVYKSIHNKFKRGVDPVNEEIESRRQ